MTARLPGLRVYGDLTLAFVGGHTWKTLGQIVVWWRGGSLRVPQFVRTDLASIPRLARPFASVAGPWARASVVHDWCYVAQPDGWTRADADALFYWIMRHDGVTAWRAWAMWLGVRAGGWVLW